MMVSTAKHGLKTMMPSKAERWPQRFECRRQGLSFGLVLETAEDRECGGGREHDSSGLSGGTRPVWLKRRRQGSVALVTWRRQQGAIERGTGSRPRY
ncbi:hypothetical protein M0R45_036210 [Rubus argutus]|uniref:Uncharacterized protein n=1 Tax=Rubus argutus TaxID=59490 RepID=A0AAW1VVF8_RUBAR